MSCRYDTGKKKGNGSQPIVMSCYTTIYLLEVRDHSVRMVMAGHHCHTAKTPGRWAGSGKRLLLKNLGDTLFNFIIAHSIVVAFLVIQQSSFTCRSTFNDFD